MSLNFYKVQIEKALISDLPAVQNLARFYVYDMSRHCGFLKGWEVPASGLYECIDLSLYFQENTRHAFLIKRGQELAGFALINQVGSSPEVDWNMGEFFIVAKYQGKGIGKTVAKQIFEKFPGIWEVMQIPENKPAIAFWKKVITEHTQGTFSEEEKKILDPSPPHRMHVFRFKQPEQNI